MKRVSVSTRYMSTHTEEHISAITAPENSGTKGLSWSIFGSSIDREMQQRFMQDSKKIRATASMKLHLQPYSQTTRLQRLQPPTGETPYRCEICSRGFTFQQSYHKHRLYHSEERPHRCDQCPKAFREISTLHNHKRIHTGEKPYSCEDCGKRFRQRVGYIVHRRIHTNERPYQCTACGRHFRYKVTLHSHKCLAVSKGNSESSHRVMEPHPITFGMLEFPEQSTVDRIVFEQASRLLALELAPDSLSYGFFKELRPSEPFITEYLLGDWFNFTETQIYQDVYPVWTYSYLATLPVVFAVTDYFRYKPVIILEGIAYVATYIMLILGNSIRIMQMVEFTYGIASSTEVAYYTYIYAKVEKDQYQKVTSYTRSAFLTGRFASGAMSQILTSTGAMDFYELNFFTFVSMVICLGIAFALPSVESSIYFHRQQRIREVETGTTVKGTPRQESGQEEPTKCYQAFGFIWEDLRYAFTRWDIIKWSVWWAFGTCGNYQVGNFIQPLWETIQPYNATQGQIYNGGVEAASTLSAAAIAFAVGYVTLNWGLIGDLVLGIVSLLEATMLGLMSQTQNIWVAYIGYVVVRMSYQVMITIISFQVAKEILPDSYGLIFGVNTFVALVLQTLLTVIVVEDIGFALLPREQFMAYCFYFSALGGLFFLMGTYTVGKHWCGRNSRSSSPSWDHPPSLLSARHLTSDHKTGDIALAQTTEPRTDESGYYYLGLLINCYSHSDMAAVLKKRALAQYSQVVEETEEVSPPKRLRLVKRPEGDRGVLSVKDLLAAFSAAPAPTDAIKLLLHISHSLPSMSKEELSEVDGHLLRCYADQGKDVRKCIISVLARIGAHPLAEPKAVVERVVGMVKKEKWKKVKAAGLRTLHAFGSALQLEHPKLRLKILLAAKQALSEGHHAVQSEALRIIGQLSGPSESGSIKLASLHTQNQDPRVRTAAYQALLDMNHRGVKLDPGMYNRVSSGLKDDYEQVRKMALHVVFTISQAHPEHAVPLSGNPESTIRLADDAFALICNGINDLSVEVRALSAELLGHMRRVSQPFLDQTLDKKLMSDMRRKKSAHERQREMQSSGEWSSGQRWADDAPKDNLDSESITLMNIGACGAFVHGLEDECMAVRMQSIDSLTALALQSPSFALQSIDFLVDMFNDEIEAVRVKAIAGLQQIANFIVLREDQLDTVLAALEDFSLDVREGLHQLLATCRLSTKTCMRTCVDALLDNLRRYPQDRRSLWRCFRDLGTHHPELVLMLVPEFLMIHPFFDSPEHDLQDQGYNWLKKGLLNAKTKSNILAIQDQCIRTRNYEKHILKLDVEDCCRCCHGPPKTVHHLLSACPKLALREYLYRHDQVCKYVHWCVCKQAGLDVPEKWYEHQPQSVVENASTKVDQKDLSGVKSSSGGGGGSITEKEVPTPHTQEFLKQVLERVAVGGGTRGWRRILETGIQDLGKLAEMEPSLTSSANLVIAFFRSQLLMDKVLAEKMWMSGEDSLGSNVSSATVLSELLQLQLRHGPKCRLEHKFQGLCRSEEASVWEQGLRCSVLSTLASLHSKRASVDVLLSALNVKLQRLIE
ncbi:unnamed protein product [Darwinula stevensoni]|uniref:C2H2-type domain-containing protein n=1 Tax=Darwinula stevensoni TaxID=69355 RepID=A0A7R9A444_9CRUS|nr:unnamed protein product [Darwinula stevensoni]CAG0889230.1 unnamed protein product [Darwinula stevensoni]